MALEFLDQVRMLGNDVHFRAHIKRTHGGKVRCKDMRIQ